MRTFMLKLCLMVAVLVSVAMPKALAYDFEYNGVGYTIISTSDFTCGASELVSDVKDLVIPNTVSYQGKELKVVKIDYQAFYGCKSIETVSIADGIVDIRGSAFLYCPNLISAKLPTDLKEIPRSLFESCIKLEEVTIPEQVEVIKSFAFCDCNLLSVVIPESTVKIEYCAFSGNDNLRYFRFGNSVKEIGDNALSMCPIENLAIPANVEYVGDNCFFWAGYNENVPDCSYDKTIRFENSESPIVIKVLNSIFSVFDGIDNMYLNRTIEIDGKHSSRVWDFSGKLLDIGRNVDMISCERIAVKCLKLGEGVTRLPKFSSDETAILDTIVVNSQIPPECPVVPTADYIRIKVLVPPGTLEIYQAADGWKNFWNIEESELASGINDVIVDTSIRPKEEIGRYDLSGRRISGDYRGVVLVRYSDGSTAKVLQQ